MLSRLLSLFKKRRITDRTSCDVPVFAFAGDRFICQATLVDLSNGGLRVQGASLAQLRRADHVLNAAKGVVYKVHLAWAAGDQAGYRCIKSSNIRGVAANGTLATIREFWSGLKTSP